MDDSIEHAREALNSSHDLLGLQKACHNAFGLYKRTRPPAAPESVARAKALPKEGMHPLLAAKVPVNSGTGLEAQVCCMCADTDASPLYACTSSSSTLLSL